jgi:hypothetical protein
VLRERISTAMMDLSVRGVEAVFGRKVSGLNHWRR